MKKKFNLKKSVCKFGMRASKYVETAGEVFAVVSFTSGNVLGVIGSVALTESANKVNKKCTKKYTKIKCNEVF